MALVTRFETPARLRDLPPGSSFYDEWHDEIDGLLGPGTSGAVPGSGFYNAATTDVTVAGERVLVWMGFPRELLTTQPAGRREAFRQGETRGDRAVVPAGMNTQVEYLEWFTSRNSAKKITRVTFTTETPEYWKALYRSRPDGARRVLELYRELLGNPAITAASLTTASGAYNPLNQWNTSRGIVHYIVDGPANTLEAALQLAAGAAGGSLVDDNYELDGLAATSADPRVVIDVKGLARRGFQVTAAEPIGIYIGGWDDTGFTKPDGSPAGDYWRVVRPVGATGPPALRLVYEVPAGEGFVVGDLSIGGRPIEFGGQIAEQLTVLVNGLAGSRA